MTILLVIYVCHSGSISSTVTFSIMSSLYSLDSCGYSAMYNKAPWSSAGSFTSDFSLRLVKQQL